MEKQQSSRSPGRVSERRVSEMASDPGKLYRQDPGRPDRCEVFLHHREWNAPQADSIRLACERGMLGCADCRQRLIRIGRSEQE